MEAKEKIAYIIGLLIVIYGAYAGRDLTNLNELIEGSLLLVWFFSIFILFIYLNKRDIGDWHRKYNDYMQEKLCACSAGVETVDIRRIAHGAAMTLSILLGTISYAYLRARIVWGRSYILDAVRKI